jgi:transcription initiation factor TFIIF subunit alpha
MHRRLQASTATSNSIAEPSDATGTAPPSSTTIKRETTPNAFSIRSRLLTKSESSGRQAADSKIVGRPKLRSVIKSEGGGNGDDELRGRSSRRTEETEDQGDDEFDYEEDFQDDEEGIAKIDDLADEEETKALEDRIRKEMRAANRIDDNAEDNEEVEEEEKLTNTGKEVKKIVKKVDKDAVNESDEEENPYASVRQNLP